MEYLHHHGLVHGGAYLNDGWETVYVPLIYSGPALYWLVRAVILIVEHPLLRCSIEPSGRLGSGTGLRRDLGIRFHPSTMASIRDHLWTQSARRLRSHNPRSPLPAFRWLLAVVHLVLVRIQPRLRSNIEQGRRRGAGEEEKARRST